MCLYSVRSYPGDFQASADVFHFRVQSLASVNRKAPFLFLRYRRNYLLFCKSDFPDDKEKALLSEEEIKDFDKATEVIQSFVDACEGIRNAFFYPISVQECLQVLIMIATYPIVPSREYFDIENAAEEAVRIFHTHINHSGE